MGRRPARLSRQRAHCARDARVRRVRPERPSMSLVDLDICLKEVLPEPIGAVNQVSRSVRGLWRHLRPPSERQSMWFDCERAPRHRPPSLSIDSTPAGNFDESEGTVIVIKIVLNCIDLHSASTPPGTHWTLEASIYDLRARGATRPTIPQPFRRDDAPLGLRPHDPSRHEPAARHPGCHGWWGVRLGHSPREGAASRRSLLLRDSRKPGGTMCGGSQLRRPVCGDAVAVSHVSTSASDAPT